MSWKKEIFLVIVMLFFISSVAKSDDDFSESIKKPKDETDDMEVRECSSHRDCHLGDYCKMYLYEESDNSTTASELSGHCESCDGTWTSMTYNYEKEQCVYCPSFRQRCLNNCCMDEDVYNNDGYEIRCDRGFCKRCKIGDHNGRSCTLQNYPDFTYKFIVAFAIAFSVALTSAIIYRWGFRARRERFLQRRISWESATIITPVQQRTLELLRDRPPEYQTRHNYRYEQEMKAKNNPDPVPVSTVTSGSLAPPPYPGSTADIENVSDNIQPPPYSRTDNSSEKTLHI